MSIKLSKYYSLKIPESNYLEASKFHDHLKIVSPKGTTW